MTRRVPSRVGPTKRLITLADGLPPIPERLLLAHAQGQVLFIAGAGVSMPAGLPSFRKLVLDIYERLDGAVFRAIKDTEPRQRADTAGLNYSQIAEVRRFEKLDYDVVLGMLERRVDNVPSCSSRVRAAIADTLRNPVRTPAPIHKALIRLADRGAGPTIITTNFDSLLQESLPPKRRPQAYSLGEIPRPSRRDEFQGVMHLHGRLADDASRLSEFVVTDQDFGEFYMRRRGIPDFIYDAARLFNLVMVGYSADDPPMRYLLNAVAADVNRFDDLNERFAFVGLEEPDPVVLEDWRGRGIEPISYDAVNKHQLLLDLLERWADLSAINGNPKRVDSEIRRIVRTPRSLATESDRDLFDHFFRRSTSAERARFASIASKAGADISWIDTVAAIALEPEAGVSE